MRIPLEYGDNFPVFGEWDPTVPWRFPRHQIQLHRRWSLAQALPWLVLVVGLTWGIYFISRHLGSVGSPSGEAVSSPGAFSRPVSKKESALQSQGTHSPKRKHLYRTRSRVA